MPPQDDSTPPDLRVEEALVEKAFKGENGDFVYDFLKKRSNSSVSDGTEETHVSSSTYSSAFTTSMTVAGIYTRDAIPREEELPKDYGLSHVTKDQIMVRRRMNTPPKHLQEKGEEVEEAMFVPEQGLVGPMFFHTDIDEHDESDDEDEEEDPDWEPRIYEERAILFQAMEHYEQLLEEPKLSKYFKAEEEIKEESDNTTDFCGDKEQVSPDADIEIPSKNLQSILEKPRFGEQIIVQGIDATMISIGDIFEIEGGLSPLKVEITCPRLCCAWVDKRNGSPFGLSGVKRFCNKSGRGGFFARVLVAGELRDEMKFVRTSHPHPKWTLEYISEALYAEGPKTYLMAGWAHWQRSKEELKELCEIEQLGLYEWKEEAQYILDHWDSYRPEDKKAVKAAKAKKTPKTMMQRIQPVIDKVRLDTIFESDAAKVSQGLVLQIVVALIACFMAMLVLSSAYKTPNFA